ncbi:MAG: hypothetical protein ACK4TN_03795 [Brevinematales bacterium]
MKAIIRVILIASLIGFVACGKKETKPEEKPTTTEQKPAVTKQSAEQEDLSFETVMKTLREALERERRENNSGTKIQTAKAYILLVKFLQTDKEKVRKAGMTDADVNFLVSDAKAKAKQRLDEVLKNPTASPEAKEEAQKLLSSL